MFHPGMQKGGACAPLTADKASKYKGLCFFYNVGMLKPAYPAQTELEMVTLEQLVPKDHLLRLLDQRRLPGIE